jgi:hypothetical protein
VQSLGSIASEVLNGVQQWGQLGQPPQGNGQPDKGGQGNGQQGNGAQGNSQQGPHNGQAPQHNQQPNGGGPANDVPRQGLPGYGSRQHEAPPNGDQWNHQPPGNRPWPGTRPLPNGDLPQPIPGTPSAQQQDMSQPPAMSPPMPVQPAQSHAGPSRARGRRYGEPEHPQAPAQVFLQSFDGAGGIAVLDPASGAVYAPRGLIGPTSGIYGTLGDVPVACYRDRGRLVLRVRDRLFDLDSGSAGIYWGVPDVGQVRFQVGWNGVCAFEASYQRPAAEFDFGLWLRDLLADEQRRAGIFR